MSTNFGKQKSLLTSPSNVLPYYRKWTFTPIISIFTKAEGDGIDSRLSLINVFYFTKSFWKTFFFQSFSRSAQPRKASSREISNTTLPFSIQPMLETPLTMFQRMSWQNTDALLTLRIEDQATVSFLKSYNEIQCFF